MGRLCSHQVMLFLISIQHSAHSTAISPLHLHSHLPTPPINSNVECADSAEHTDSWNMQGRKFDPERERQSQLNIKELNYENTTIQTD